MRTPYGAWRVTYTPGSWVALSGPTSMVVLQPIGPEASELLNMLWDELLPSASANEITARLTGYGLDAMPNLAVFFWEDDQLYCLLRGSVQVLDADTSQVLATGSGARTWREAELASPRVQVLLEDADLAELLQLPLVIGAARVSSIFLDAEVAASVPAAPQVAREVVGPEAGAQVPEPEPEPEPEAGQPAVVAQPDVSMLGPVTPAVVPDAVVAATPAATVPPVAVPPTAGPERSFEPTQVLGQRPPFAPGQGPDAEPDRAPADEDEPSALADRGFGQGPRGTTGPWGPQGFTAAAKDQPVPVEPVVQQPEPVVQPEPAADETVLEAAVEPEPVEPEPLEPEPGRAEPEPESAPQLRPVQPEPAEEPVWAILATSAGDRVRLVRPLVIGRAPSSAGDDPEAELLRVPSPNHDISRTHVRIEPAGWQVEVTDLNSTNGTRAISPDGETRLLEPGIPTIVDLGWTLDIGDGLTILLEPPV